MSNACIHNEALGGLARAKTHPEFPLLARRIDSLLGQKPIWGLRPCLPPMSWTAHD